MSDTSSVTTNFFAKGDEAYAATLSSSISAGAATVPVTVSTAGDYVDGDIAALTVSPGTSNQATFIGRKSGSSWLDCVWTEGNTGVGQSSGATVIDYDSATHQSALVKGILQFAKQNAHLIPTKLYDTNDNETLELGVTASAVNHVKVTNAATGNAPVIEPTGGDTNTGLTIQGKNTGTVIITALAPRFQNAGKTANYTATANDHTLRCDATSGAFTVTLPTAASIAGKRYTIVKTDTSANVVTVDGAGSETIDGATTFSLAGQYCTVTIESDGTNWIIVAAASQYSSYTPAWTSTGTAPAIGNGTLTGRFQKVGRRVDFSIALTLGTTSTQGTGSYRLSLPFATSQTLLTNIGGAYSEDLGTAAYNGWMQILTTTTVFWSQGTTAAIGAGTPANWATGDYFLLHGSYETAT